MPRRVALEGDLRLRISQTHPFPPGRHPTAQKRLLCRLRKTGATDGRRPVEDTDTSSGILFPDTRELSALSGCTKGNPERMMNRGLMSAEN